KLLDTVGAWAAVARLLGLSTKPLALDSSYYESRHVSRHYEKRCRETRKRMYAKLREKGRASSRSKTVKSLPKIAIAVATHSHLVLALRTTTGAGADHPDFEPLVFDSWRRVPNRRFKVVADAGYDSEKHHDLARREMGLTTLIPPEHGRPSKTGAPPQG